MNRQRFFDSMSEGLEYEWGNHGMTDELATAEKQASELAEKARQWVASTSGREAIEQIITQSEQVQSELMRARRVDPETLNEPVNL